VIKSLDVFEKDIHFDQNEQRLLKPRVAFVISDNNADKSKQ